MPADIDRMTGPLPGYRGTEQMAVGSDDIAFDPPRTVRAETAGNIAYTDMDGYSSSVQGAAAGDSIVGPGNALVLVAAIDGANTTVTSILTGII